MSRIGYLGPKGSNSHEAATTQGRKSQLVAYSSFELIKALERKKVETIVLPIENSTEGSTNWVLDLFFTNNFPFLIKGEIVLPVHHHLIGFGRISDVKEIYSHPQALGQCRQFWNKLKVKTRDTDSTSEAVQLVAQKQDKTIAAIGTKLASELYQAPIIKKNIADNRNNQTRFIVLGRKKRKKTGRDKTSFVFGTKNRSGALVEVLQVFKVLHINMTMLVPRPSKKRLGEYVFFADVEAHQRDRHLGAAFQALKEGRWVTFLRIFGSYPKAKKQNS